MWITAFGARYATVSLSQGDLLLAELYWLEEDRSREQFLAALDCEPEDYEWRRSDTWREGDTLAAYRDSSVSLLLATIDGQPSVLVLNVEEEGTKAVWDHRARRVDRRYRRLYFLGVRDVTFVGIDGSEIILSVLWDCQPEPQEIRFSLQSYQPVLQVKTE